MPSFFYTKNNLFPQELAGCNAGYPLEEAGEVVREVKAQHAGGLVDVVALHQQALGLVDDVVVDVADGRTASCLVDEVSEITGRIGQFRGAIGDGGQAVKKLPVLAEVLLKQVVKTLQQIVATLVVLRELAQVTIRCLAYGLDTPLLIIFNFSANIQKICFTEK